MGETARILEQIWYLLWEWHKKKVNGVLVIRVRNGEILIDRKELFEPGEPGEVDPDII